MQEKGASVRAAPYLHERMFPRFREQIGTALDLIVEFSTLGEYRLGVVSTPGAPGAPADAPGHAPRLGGAGENAERAAVRVGVAGGPAGMVPVATPAARRGALGTGPREPVLPPCRGERRRGAEPRPLGRSRKGVTAPAEQLCLAV